MLRIVLTLLLLVCAFNCKAATSAEVKHIKEIATNVVEVSEPYNITIAIFCSNKFLTIRKLTVYKGKFTFCFYNSKTFESIISTAKQNKCNNDYKNNTNKNLLYHKKYYTPYPLFLLFFFAKLNIFKRKEGQRWLTKK